MDYLVVDIETIPDVTTGRRLYGLQGIDDDLAVAEAMFLQRRNETGGSAFLRHTLQQIVCISCLLRTDEHLKIWSLSGDANSEKEMLIRFFSGLERYVPVLVTWNGLAFDLPVLSYRALLHGVTASLFWEQGERDREFRYNNYLNRYHQRHIDLMDTLSLFQSKAVQRLDHVACLLGFPGKMGLSGEDVWPAWQAGRFSQVRTYCETDVMNTWLVFLRFQRMRNQLTEEGLQQEEQRLKQLLESGSEPVWHEFLQEWQNER